MKPDSAGTSRQDARLFAGLLALLCALHGVLASASEAAQPRLLFSSGFEGDTRILPPEYCWDTGCWQDIIGVDAVTAFEWPPAVRNGGGRFLLLTDPVRIDSFSIERYMFNRLETVTGPHNTATRALYQQISRNINGRAPMGTSPAQNEFQFLPGTGSDELFVSYWLKLQPDLVARMTGLPPGPGIDGGGTWRAIFAFKTGGRMADGRPLDNGDYRVEVYVETRGGRRPYWVVNGDNNAGGGAPAANQWSEVNRDIPVPVGKWFKFEIYWNRSDGDDGRVRVAVDGKVIVDRHGPNMGAWHMPINRIMAPMLYAGGSMPIYQWVDDLQVWSAMPENRQGQ